MPHPGRRECTLRRVDREARVEQHHHVRRDLRRHRDRRRVSRRPTRNGGSPVTTVEAEPYAWPYDGTIDPGRTAMICIDWQVDFCGPGGYVDAMGYDLNLTRAGLEPTAKVLA